jgi:hypothetical protein
MFLFADYCIKIILNWEDGNMDYTTEIEKMTCVAKGVNHGPAPIPEEGRW